MGWFSIKSLQLMILKGYLADLVPGRFQICQSSFQYLQLHRFYGKSDHPLLRSFQWDDTNEGRNTLIIIMKCCLVCFSTSREIPTMWSFITMEHKSRTEYNVLYRVSIMLEIFRLWFAWVLNNHVDINGYRWLFQLLFMMKFYHKLCDSCCVLNT